MVALRGEIRSSSVRSRDVKNKLMLAAHLLTKGMACWVQWQRGPWRRDAANGQCLLERYMKDIGVGTADLENMKKEIIKLRVDEFMEKP